VNLRRLLVLLSFLPAAGVAADAPWTSLLNGRDLAGWNIVGPAELAPIVAEHGEIVLRQRRNSPEHTFLAT
jgi:hypothetical protein